MKDGTPIEPPRGSGSSKGSVASKVPVGALSGSGASEASVAGVLSASGARLASASGARLASASGAGKVPASASEVPAGAGEVPVAGASEVPFAAASDGVVAGASEGASDVDGSTAAAVQPQLVFCKHCGVRQNDEHIVCDCEPSSDSEEEDDEEVDEDVEEDEEEKDADEEETRVPPRRRRKAQGSAQVSFEDLLNDAVAASSTEGVIFTDIAFEDVHPSDVNSRLGNGNAFLESEDEGSDVFEGEYGGHDEDAASYDESSSEDEASDNVLPEVNLVTRDMSQKELDALHLSGPVVFIYIYFL